MTRVEKELPKSSLEMEPLVQAPSYEIVGGKLHISFKPDMPTVKLNGVEFSADEKPCVVIGKKKSTVLDVI
jgi:hypothetical protein